MKNLLFKGKRSDNGEWIIGDIKYSTGCVFADDGIYIIICKPDGLRYAYHVDQETVERYRYRRFGQFKREENII